MSIRVLHVGLGPIGERVLNQVIDRRGFEAVGAVDIDPAKVGKDIGEIVGMETQGVAVGGSLDEALKTTRPDVVALCTTSKLATIMDDMETILGAQIPVVSTTETLSYPFFHAPELSSRLDELAKIAGVAVVGTGVNPGFAMDTVPIAVTAACRHVDRIEVDRLQDASPRRLPFQQKIGAGLEEDDFRDRVSRGELGHVGLGESIAMIANAMGWELDEITDIVEPRIAEEDVASSVLSVKKGQASGIIQDGAGLCDDYRVFYNYSLNVATRHRTLMYDNSWQNYGYRIRLNRLKVAFPKKGDGVIFEGPVTFTKRYGATEFVVQ